MASSKVMPSSTTSNFRNSDLSSHHHLHHHHRHLNHPSSDPMTSDFTPNSDTHRCNNADDLASPIHGIFYAQNSDDAEISLIDAAGAISAVGAESSMRRKTADEVWREILAGKGGEFKAEAASDEMMTLEDFLAKAGEGGEEEDIKVTLSGPPILNQSGGFIGFDHHPLVQNQNSFPMGFGNGGGEMVVGGRGKRRGGPMMETLDKAAQQRQKRMIKNRESAARSRERKQAYQVELESLALKLEEENEQLVREKVERTNERYKQLMEKVVPVVEKRQPARTLRRVRSMQW